MPLAAPLSMILICLCRDAGFLICFKLGLELEVSSGVNRRKEFVARILRCQDRDPFVTEARIRKL